MHAEVMRNWIYTHLSVYLYGGMPYFLRGFTLQVIELSLFFIVVLSSYPLACSSTLKMKAACSSETTFDYHRGHVPEDGSLHYHLCENHGRFGRSQ
jgi:hypothetical protein